MSASVIDTRSTRSATGSWRRRENSVRFVASRSREEAKTKSPGASRVTNEVDYLPRRRQATAEALDRQRNGAQAWLVPSRYNPLALSHGGIVISIASRRARSEFSIQEA